MDGLWLKFGDFIDSLAFLPIACSLIILVWFSLVWRIGEASGWHRLTKRYVVQDWEDLRWNFTSGRIGRHVSRGRLGDYLVATSQEGLVVRFSFMFRFSNRPIYIPWDRIAEIEMRDSIWVKQDEVASR